MMMILRSSKVATLKIIQTGCRHAAWQTDWVWSRMTSRLRTDGGETDVKVTNLHRLLDGKTVRFSGPSSVHSCVLFYLPERYMQAHCWSRLYTSKAFHEKENDGGWRQTEGRRKRTKRRGPTTEPCRTPKVRARQMDHAKHCLHWCPRIQSSIFTPINLRLFFSCFNAGITSSCRTPHQPTPPDVPKHIRVLTRPHAHTSAADHWTDLWVTATT